MRKDIKAINEAFSKVHKEQSDNTDMKTNTSPNTSPKVSDDQKHDILFYRTWEDIVDGLSDDQLTSTLYMIRNFDELNKLIKDEYRYRNEMVEA
jgi:hypothetical protein